MPLISSRRYYSSMNIFASVLLFISALAAAVLANSPLAEYYHSFLNMEVCLQIGNFNLLSHGGHNMTMLQFINDGLMTVFFLIVGLEIKRELLVGELSSFRKASLPFIAACGGMILPVLIYATICPPGTSGDHGLAIPMATDIAFSLGVLSLLGTRVPVSLKVFLTAFAVVDDIGGILIIAIFYSSHVHLIYFLWAALIYAFLYFIGKRRTVNKVVFLIGGIAAWYLFMQSGVHSTISGVLLAFVIPARPRLNAGKYVERIRRLINSFPTMCEEGKDNIVLTNQQISKLKRVESASDRVISTLQAMEDSLHNSVNYLILPLFAFANAGVVFGGGSGDLIGNVSLGIMLGLIIGKFVGIFGFTWLAIKTKLAPMGEGMNWKNIAGVSLLGGIGFTVSLFIGNLSFGEEPILLNQAKLGVIAGSVVSGILGYIVLSRVLSKKR
ncbi:Na+/H+ antiporter NhaA [Bacteroides sp. 224]|uniref:Na+/H+ antiporter NhaA n=1 Tax=Bacteroides sp. 224 TaxID=2302936 RepID=UPI0013D8C0D2|nr:Na+/H+ antiporter NhaA [Bacteroides sp. 224]NDV64494.1 Na+/H+ antiporter NhaA [Bacteroides sp. 224]